MIRFWLSLIGTAILATGCVQGDAPRAGTPATGAAKAQETAKTARVIAAPGP